MAPIVYVFVPAGLVERAVHHKGKRASYAWKQGYACVEAGAHWMTRSEAHLFAQANGGHASFPATARSRAASIERRREKVLAAELQRGGRGERVAERLRALRAKNARRA